ncbi:VOC family protein [Paenibacillus sp. FSL H8-0332]|uniref:VOC family protein n=1 Tax=Paenibacillus sp. FSL H8-0332 TaxID=2954742 RepID=UPI0030D4F52E
MSVDVNLIFNGNAREAVEFYAEVFGIEKNHFMTFGEFPPHPDYPLPEEAKNLVMLSRLNIDGSNVRFSDVYPGSPFIAGNNISLSLVNADMDRIKAAFDKLKVGGTVVMELQETFWSKLYGGLIDKFGITWQFSYEDGSMNM